MREDDTLINGRSVTRCQLASFPSKAGKRASERASWLVGWLVGWPLYHLPLYHLSRRRKAVREKATNRRASNKGFLDIGLGDYLQLLDWTGRQIRSGKRGAIPKHLAPILQRLDMSPAFWVDYVRQFHKFSRTITTYSKPSVPRTSGQSPIKSLTSRNSL